MSTPPPPMQQSALPQEPAQPALSEPARIINTFVAPRKTFADIQRKPGWIWPWLLIAAISIAFAFVAVQKLDIEQLVRQGIEHSAMAQRRMEQLTPDQRERGIAMQATITKVTFFIYPGLVLIGGIVVAAILMAVFNFGFGAEVSFERALSVTIYSFLPGIVGAVLLLISTLISSDPNSIDFGSGNPIPTSPAFFMDSNGNKFLYTLMSSIDLIRIWEIILLGLGFAIVASAARKKLSPSTAITTIFVIYFVLAIARAGLAAAF
jgi:predicted anti-sigma-YlaC factor YlaD